MIQLCQTNNSWWGKATLAQSAAITIIMIYAFLISLETIIVVLYESVTSSHQTCHVIIAIVAYQTSHQNANVNNLVATVIIQIRIPSVIVRRAIVLFLINHRIAIAVIVQIQQNPSQNGVIGIVALQTVQNGIKWSPQELPFLNFVNTTRNYAAIA